MSLHDRLEAGARSPDRTCGSPDGHRGSIEARGAPDGNASPAEPTFPPHPVASPHSNTPSEHAIVARDAHEQTPGQRVGREPPLGSMTHARDHRGYPLQTWVF